MPPVHRPRDEDRAPVGAHKPAPATESTPAPSETCPEDTHLPAALSAREEPRQKARARFKPRIDARKFEWLLGARGLALGGVVIVVVGFGMFLKYAYDEGWIASIAPAWRCAGTGGFGLLLIALGEVLRRKINPLASTGVTAAGIAIAFGSILAAEKLYGLVPVPAAFAMMAAVTVGGVLLGSVSNRVTLSLLSLLGAFLVPPLLSTGEPSYVAMPGYLLCLLALGLALSAWRGGAYAHVRRLAWWGTGILGTLWIGTVYDDRPASPIAFAALAWGMTVVELILSARFFTAVGGRPGWPETSRTGFRRDNLGEIRFDPRSLLAPEARWLNAAFGATIWAVTAVSVTVRAHRPELDFLSPLGFGLASLLAAFIATGASRRAWLPELPSPRSALASALAVNALLLMVATIATALGGWVQVIAWCAVGVAAVETARRLRFRALAVFGFALVGVALARLLTIDLVEHVPTTPDITALDLAFGPWSAQLALVGIAWGAVAFRSRGRFGTALGACLVPWCLAFATLHPDSGVHAIGAAMATLAALAGWTTLRLAGPANRINACVLGAIGLLIAWSGQFDLAITSEAALRIVPASLIVTGLAIGAVAALPRNPFWLRVTSAALAIACGVIAIARLDETHGTDRALLAESVYAALVLLAGVRLRRWSLAEIAGVLLMVLALVWGAVQAWRGRSVFEGPPLIHTAFSPAGLTVIGLIFAGVLLHRGEPAADAPRAARKTRRVLAHASHGAAWALLLASTSIEAARLARTLFEETTARSAAVSIWWSLFAVASVVLGFRVGAPLRWAGLVLLAVVGGKVLLIDTVTLNQPSRIVAAITVGLVTIGASVLYARIAGKQSGESTEASDPV